VSGTLARWTGSVPAPTAAPRAPVKTVKTAVAVAAKAAPRVAAAAATGRAVDAAAAARADASGSGVLAFEFERRGFASKGRITIRGTKLEGRLAAAHATTERRTELNLEGSFDQATGLASGTVRGSDVTGPPERAFTSAWEGVFDGELRGDRLELRFSGTFTRGEGPTAPGTRIPRGSIVARPTAP
jgi:hypothetical protein